MLNGLCTAFGRSVISQVAGESIDIAPTVANVLGFDQEIPAGMLQGRVLEEAFV